MPKTSKMLNTTMQNKASFAAFMVTGDVCDIKTQMLMTHMCEKVIGILNNNILSGFPHTKK